MTNTESLLLDNQRLIMVALAEVLHNMPGGRFSETAQTIRIRLEERIDFVDANTKAYFENLDRLGVAP